MVMTPDATAVSPSPAAARPVDAGEALPGTSNQAATVAELRWIDVAEIHPAEDNLRQELGDLSDLASVATLGVVEPLLLTPRAAGGYTIVAGHRRHAAAAAAGIARVPASIRAYTDGERIEVMLVENLQRRDLSPLDEARGYRRLLDLGLRQQAIAERLGVSQSHVSKRLCLLSLPPSALDALYSGGITVGEALELTKLAQHPSRLDQALRVDRRWGGITQAVEAHLDEQRREEKREASLGELQARGVTIVTPPEYGIWYGRDEQPLDDLELDPVEHAKEDCHGAAVMDDGQIVWVCRNPENHTSPCTEATEVRTEVEQGRTETEYECREREKDRARRAAAKARDEHWRRLVTADSLQGGTVDFVLREMLRDASSRGTATAARWLGLEPERDRWGCARYDDALAAYAAQGPKHLHRAAFAAALGQAEEVFHAWGGGTTKLRHVTDLLEATGYTLTQVEIDRITPREGHDDEEDDDVARCRVCGCTEDEPCEGGCEWVEDPLDDGDLCSRCAIEHGLAGEIEEGTSS
jgi:ParB family transcriptional regulator, chromosome partitioning protein